MKKKFMIRQAIFIALELNMMVTCGTGGGGSGEFFACADICAHDEIVILPSLKLAVFSWVVL